MSSTTIFILIIAGILALLIIGYINHSLERSKLERARRKADLADRCRRCANLSTGLPSQLMTADLKQLLSRLELHYTEQLQAFDRNDSQLKQRAAELRQMLEQGAEIPLDNLPVKISTDQQAKEVRFQLEGLQAQIVRATEDKILTVAVGKQWLDHLKHLLVTLYIEYFTTVGQQFLTQNRPAQARLAYERAVQYLKKQADRTLYKTALEQFTAQLENARVLEAEQAEKKAEAITELTSGLESQAEEDWKKKQIYD